ncbi:MAG: diphthamide synthesis protein [archaeon]
MKYNLEDLEEKYELELGKIIEEILRLQVCACRSQEFKVLLQLPDGLKTWGPLLVDYIFEKTGVEVRIWLGDCFGACDLPDSDCDLVVQFGHAEW